MIGLMCACFTLFLLPILRWPEILRLGTLRVWSYINMSKTAECRVFKLEPSQQYQQSSLKSSAVWRAKAHRGSYETAERRNFLSFVF